MKETNVLCVCFLENKFILKLGNKCIFAKGVETQVGGNFLFFVMVIGCSAFLGNVGVLQKLVLLSVSLCLQLNCLVALNMCDR